MREIIEHSRFYHTVCMNYGTVIADIEKENFLSQMKARLEGRIDGLKTFWNYIDQENPLISKAQVNKIFEEEFK